MTGSYLPSGLSVAHANLAIAFRRFKCPVYISDLLKRNSQSMTNIGRSPEKGNVIGDVGSTSLMRSG